MIATRTGYKSAESSSKSNQFRNSLTPNDFSGDIPAYFDLTADDYSDVGNRTNADNETIATVYKLNLTGFGRSNLLRSGEEFTVEIYATGGAPTAGDAYKSQKVSRGDTWYGTSKDSGTDVSEKAYYFLMPASPKAPNQGSYAARLTVTAK